MSNMASPGISRIRPNRFFVTATGTSVGKTFVTAALTHAARVAGLSVRAVKPVVSGFDRLEGSDPGILLEAQGLPPSELESICRWRFKEPLAPDMAARREGRTLSFDELVDWSKEIVAGPEEIVFIEGIGGIMVPIDERQTVLDWIRALNIPVLLVAGSYLGTISHTLSALSVLRHANIPIEALIVSESPDATTPFEETARSIERFCGRLVTRAPRRVEGDWRHAPELLRALPLPHPSAEARVV